MRQQLLPQLSYLQTVSSGRHRSVQLSLKILPHKLPQETQQTPPVTTLPQPSDLRPAVKGTTPPALPENAPASGCPAHNEPCIPTHKAPASRILSYLKSMPQRGCSTAVPSVAGGTAPGALQQDVPFRAPACATAENTTCAPKQVAAALFLLETRQQRMAALPQPFRKPLLQQLSHMLC